MKYYLIVIQWFVIALLVCVDSGSRHHPYIATHNFNPQQLMLCGFFVGTLACIRGDAPIILAEANLL